MTTTLTPTCPAAIERCVAGANRWSTASIALAIRAT